MDLRCSCVPTIQQRSLFALVSGLANPKYRIVRRLSKLRAAGLVPIVFLVPAVLYARQLPRDQPLPPLENTTRVRAYEAGADIEFGRSVSYDGTRIAVGAPDDDEGAVRIYTRSGSEGRWELETRLPFPDEALGLVGFGTAIAIEGDTVAIGAPGVLNEDIRVRGAVYVYERADGQWQQSARLQRFTLPPDVPPLNLYPFERF
ncbi:MAG: FG-GAP repeat protein, partial [Myxococcota bacterium]